MLEPTVSICPQDLKHRHLGSLFSGLSLSVTHFSHKSPLRGQICMRNAHNSLSCHYGQFTGGCRGEEGLSSGSLHSG